MRILSGRLKGRNLILPRELGYRPALGIVRKALFDSLRFKIKPEQFFLDLFGGSGSIGVEAYSQGIDNVRVNELDRANFSVLQENIKRLGLEDRITLTNTDYVACLKRCVDAGIHFDFIYTAPPYSESDFYAKTVDFVKKNSQLLAPGGMLIIECLKQMDFDFEGFRIIRDKNYGSTRLVQLVLNASGKGS